MGIQFINYNSKRISDKNRIKKCALGRLKVDTYTKKIRQIKSVLVNLQGCSVILKIAKKLNFKKPCVSKPRRPFWRERRLVACFFNITNSSIIIRCNLMFQRYGTSLVSLNQSRNQLTFISIIKNTRTHFKYTLQ